MTEFNAQVAMEQFEKRKANNEKKEQTNNAMLPSGSPMYYYCRKCYVLIATLPESHLSSVPKYCDPCKVLVDHGLI